MAVFNKVADGFGHKLGVVTAIDGNAFFCQKIFEGRGGGQVAVVGEGDGAVARDDRLGVRRAGAFAR